jgi:hypothetical protein
MSLVSRGGTMLIGVFSGVLGHGKSLEGLLKDIGGVDLLFCLGNIYDDSLQPNDDVEYCASLLKKKGVITTAGMNDQKARHLFGQFHARKENWFFADLQREIAGKDVHPDLAEYHFMHGKPDFWNYVHEFRDEQDVVSFMYGREEKRTIYFTGHSRRAKIIEIDGGVTVYPSFYAMGNFDDTPGVQDDIQCTLKDGACYVIDVGSIAAPRDGPKGSFALVDTETSKVWIPRFGIPDRKSVEKIELYVDRKSL